MSGELLGVIVGGLIGLASALMGHAFGWFQLKSTRAFSLRQTVYMDATVQLASSLEFFSSVSKLDLDDHEVASLMRSVSSAMFKIHIVGSPDTIAALSTANYELTQAAANLMPRRAILRSLAAAASTSTGSDINEQIQRLTIELAIEAMSSSLRYQRHLAELNIAARRELGLAIDEAEYRKANLKAEERIVAVIDSLRGRSDAA